MTQPVRKANVLCLAAALACGGACDRDAPDSAASGPAASTRPASAPLVRRPRGFKVVHVFVALCDNAHQGIVRVPAAIGNGQDPASNLYWGARYGLRTFFRRSGHWQLVASADRPGRSGVLARVVFRGRAGGAGVYVVADAYDGSRMKATLLDFLRAAAGRDVQTVAVAADRVELQAGGWADLVCFVGHNGLVDVRLGEAPRARRGARPEHAVVLACKSDSYFAEPLRLAGCPPLVTTHGLMCPEAYTLDAIVRSWAGGESAGAVRRKAAGAYARYQKCSLPAASRLFGAGG